MQNLEIKDFAKKIGITDKDIEVICDYRIKPFAFFYYCRLLHSSPQLLLKVIKKKPNFRRIFLEFFVKYAVKYRQKYIDFFGGDIYKYYAQFRDIAIWLNNAKNKFGEVGIDEANWVINCFTLFVIRIGRLQYERIPYTHNELKNPGLKLHTIHIPRDGRLDYDEVIASLKAASIYFNTDRFYCRSWLLSPEIIALLPEDSNIKKFASFFTPIAKVASRQAEDFVFGNTIDDPTKYPENSSLQRLLKQAISNGTTLTEGIGIVDVTKL